MSELEGMINGILSNPDEMKKIMEMAGKIMGEGGLGAENPADSTTSSTTIPSDLLSGLDLNNIAGLASAAQGLLNNGTVKKLLSSPWVTNLVSEATRPNNDKKELFNALKPWLSEKRRHKLERAIIFARVMRVAGVAAPFIRGG